MEDYTRENGLLTGERAKAMRGIGTEENTKENLQIINQTAKGYIIGKMGKFMKGNGSQVSKKATVYGEAHKGIPILASGKTENQKGMECTTGKMVTNTKGSG